MPIYYPKKDCEFSVRIEIVAKNPDDGGIKTMSSAFSTGVPPSNEEVISVYRWLLEDKIAICPHCNQGSGD